MQTKIQECQSKDLTVLVAHSEGNVIVFPLGHRRLVHDKRLLLKANGGLDPLNAHYFIGAACNVKRYLRRLAFQIELPTLTPA